MQTAPAKPLVRSGASPCFWLGVSPAVATQVICVDAIFYGVSRLACPSLYVPPQPSGGEALSYRGCDGLGLRCTCSYRISEEKNIMDASKIKMAYSISERNGKSYFSKVGVGFVNKDGSWNLKLESFPISGEIHIRDYVPREDGDAPGVARARGNAQARAAAAE